MSQNKVIEWEIKLIFSSDLNPNLREMLKDSFRISVTKEEYFYYTREKLNMGDLIEREVIESGAKVFSSYVIVHSRNARDIINLCERKNKEKAK